MFNILGNVYPHDIDINAYKSTHIFIVEDDNGARWSITKRFLTKNKGSKQLKIEYKYRFKTEEEFIKEYGENWRDYTDWNSHGEMDYLFGKKLDQDFPENSYDMVIEDHEDDTWYNTWYINRKMLVRYPVIPDYKPKKFSREI